MTKEQEEKLREEFEKKYIVKAVPDEFAIKIYNMAVIESLYDFITQAVKAREEEIEKTMVEKIEKIRADERIKIFKTLRSLEIEATRKDNPKTVEQAEMVKTIWEQWIKPVVINSLGFTSEEVLEVMKQDANR